MINRITLQIHLSEKIYFLKVNLSEEPKKLISLEEEFEVALAMLDSVYGNETKVLQTKIQDFINIVHEDPSEKNSIPNNRNLWNRFKLFHNFLSSELSKNGEIKVLNSLITSLVLQRIPYQLRGLLVKARREMEEKDGTTLTVESLLKLYNNFIHDLEISQGTNKEKKKKTDEKYNKDTEKDKSKVQKRTLVSKQNNQARDDRKCHLCDGDHRTRSHRFNNHGHFTINQIRNICRQKNLCLTCADPISIDTNCQKGTCNKITRDCYWCNMRTHVNILCPQRSEGRKAEGGAKSNGASESISKI